MSPALIAFRSDADQCEYAVARVARASLRKLAFDTITFPLWWVKQLVRCLAERNLLVEADLRVRVLRHTSANPSVFTVLLTLCH